MWMLGVEKNGMKNHTDQEMEISKTGAIETTGELEFVAIVEVPEHKKIVCQAEGCGHSVFRRVHVIKQGSDIGVFGSTCAAKMFGQLLKNSRPTIHMSEGINLSEPDVELLEQNTRELIAKLQRELEKENLKTIAEVVDYLFMTDTQLEQYCLDEVKSRFRKERGINPDLSGWAGWVQSDASALFEKRRGNRKES
jgi:hypothetical protein